MNLADAIAAHVRPGMHLHFASTPSRSNAAVREVARAFAGRAQFTLSSTGFHSMLHLLPMLGMAERLIGAFYGDHTPAPRPHALYGELERRGTPLELWSLWSLVSAFRAGAQGDAWAVNRSLAGTDTGRALAAHGRYREVALGDGETLGLVAALRPDVTFVHAAAGDADGNVVATGPFSEGMWSAMAAKRGAIVTVERLVSRAWMRARADRIVLPPQRVLAVCEEPHGAHPQSFHCAEDLGIPGYRDDFAAYDAWRGMYEDPAAFARFCADVLDASDAGAAYRASIERAAPTRPSISAPDPLVLAAAQHVADRAIALDARAIFAGIGQAFHAARIAQGLLAARGRRVRVMVETGLDDIDCGPASHPYLLAYENVVRAGRLSSIDDILGVLGCGADNRCLAVLGAAEVDRDGSINSTRVGGRLLVGSGGACDIAAGCAEAIVVARADRVVERVEHVTSTGRNVRSIVTERGTLSLKGSAHAYPDLGDRDLSARADAHERVVAIAR